MKVVVLGGYGVFGGRLARLLLRDGVNVWVAGRDLAKAEAFARCHGGWPLSVDGSRDLAPILEAAPDFVVDAAGPFQSYGADPYRLARFCIAHSIHYLDLSDDGAFTVGIRALDQAAKAAGCIALSGVSSVPAISSSAVARLSAGLSEILLIETAILPGNRSPRGQSVVLSILAQAGSPLRIWRGGAWRERFGWTEPKSVALNSAFKRSTWLIGAPDLILFPNLYKARSVIFRAGLELGLMNRGLAFMGFLRRRRLLPDLRRLFRPLFWLSKRLAPFGSDTGGMIVEVTGLDRGQPTRRRWQLIATAGEGPFIPAIPARAVIRRRACIAAGARPFLADLTLADIERAMADLSVNFAYSEEKAPTLFQAALKDKWHELPPCVQRLHSVQDVESFSGRARVSRGRSLFARLAAWFFMFPKAAEDVPLVITKTRTPTGEIWERNFGGRIFRSYLTPSPQPFHYRERFWAFTYEQELPVRNAALHLPVRRGWFLGLPLPFFLLPQSRSREFAINDRFHFDVALYAPLTGELIVRYEGQVNPDAQPFPPGLPGEGDL